MVPADCLQSPSGVIECQLVSLASFYNDNTPVAGTGLRFGIAYARFDPLPAQLPDVVFVVSLVWKIIILGTVEGHLSTFLRFPDQPLLFKSPIVIRFLKKLQDIFPLSFCDAQVRMEWKCISKAHGYSRASQGRPQSLPYLFDV